MTTSQQAIDGGSSSLSPGAASSSPSPLPSSAQQADMSGSASSPSAAGPIQPSITTDSITKSSPDIAAPSSPKSPESSSNIPSGFLADSLSDDERNKLTTSLEADNAVRISLLLTSGARHPFTINKRFLQRRNITAVDEDPWNISVYDMKSLIWHEWLSEWESRPTSPAYIRLIYLGGLLDDKKALKDCRLSKTEPNVVHMTIKPQDMHEEEDIKGKESKGGGASSRSGGGCCIIL